jgi:hypothetical protein
MTPEMHLARRASTTAEVRRAIVRTTEGPRNAEGPVLPTPTLRHAVR